MPPPFVVEEVITADCSDENIGAAIVVVVSDGDAHPIEGNVQAGAGGHVCEVALAVVPIKSRAAARPRQWIEFRLSLVRARRFPRPPGAIDEQDVLRAIAIEV